MIVVISLAVSPDQALVHSRAWGSGADGERFLHLAISGTHDIG